MWCENVPAVRGGVAAVSVILYIAGPMSGLPDSNYPAFFAAEDRLRAVGYHRILNPARSLCPDGSSWDAYMRSALVMVAQCEGIALLPGSHNSRGARLERQIAEAMGWPVARLDEWVAMAQGAAS